MILNPLNTRRHIGPSNSLELLFDSQTNFTTAGSQIQMSEQLYSVSQVLSGETANTRFLNLKAKVTDIGCHGWALS